MQEQEIALQLSQVLADCKKKQNNAIQKKRMVGDNNPTPTTSEEILEAALLEQTATVAAQFLAKLMHFEAQKVLQPIVQPLIDRETQKSAAPASVSEKAPQSKKSKSDDAEGKDANP